MTAMLSVFQSDQSDRRYAVMRFSIHHSCERTLLVSVVAKVVACVVSPYSGSARS